VGHGGELTECCAQVLPLTLAVNAGGGSDAGGEFASGALNSDRVWQQSENRTKSETIFARAKFIVDELFERRLAKLEGAPRISL